ncbi:hypothetical protein [Pseudomonas sp. 5P_3.1_Bac2]|uniref:hypothetical protein n=1 Tax=Pseudomonas sp. 5P_3.1_Bac2 TaxID=2971617 RepID=UPI0021C5E9FB|nr:hypothetical protein [Pseudomonas sp. 5P_3.1_Bac2]MCU1718749.1 hypothetical protein [Pseudomonas sp. 5P_3.1_Bac2]
MNTINASHDLANVSFSRDELLVLNAALNEICNGVDVFEFETRIGADREFVTGLLQGIGSVLDDMDQLSS